LRTLDGSGPGGRIIRIDVERAIAERAAREAGVPADGGSRQPAQASGPASQARRPTGEAAAVGKGPGVRPVPDSNADLRDPTEVPLSSLRRVIARRLLAAAQEIPAFTVTVAAQGDELSRLRAQLNEHLGRVGRGKVSVNDLVIKAAALALRQHPEVNASWGEDRLWHHRRINLGVAVAAPKGLMVPVVLDADAKTPAQIGAEVRSLVALATDGKLSPEQMSGGTFTVSNLGMYGVEEFTAIINPPEVAILAVGAARPELDLLNGEVVLRQVMRLTLTADHRVVDGALAAQFLGTVRGLLENPLSLVA
jgi:pyruvate dehydrogenase E2 component (dihydrolipoamide acetyltransferase)